MPCKLKRAEIKKPPGRHAERHHRKTYSCAILVYSCLVCACLFVNAVPLRIRHYQYTKRRTVCQRFFAMLSNFFENADTPPPIDFPSADCRLGESVFRRAYAFVVSATVKRTPRCAFALTRLSRQRRSTKSLNTRIISSETTCSMRQAFSSASLGVAPTFISTFVSV